MAVGEFEPNQLSQEELNEIIFTNSLKACINGEIVEGEGENEITVPVSRLVADEVMRKLPYIGEVQMSAADVAIVATCTSDIVTMNPELQKLSVARRARIYVNTLDRIASRSDDHIFDGYQRRHDLATMHQKMIFQHKYFPRRRAVHVSRQRIL